MSHLLGILLLCTGTAWAKQPNILLIFADDIGYEALNCYGGMDFKTPWLNQMAKEGLRFERAYTSPACTPSRVSMHTGLYVNRHGHIGILPVHEGTDKTVDFQHMRTYAQLMRGNGYLTSVTGKWQLATLERHPNHVRDAGFDSWCIWQIWKDGKKTLRHWNPTFNHDGKVRDDIADRFGPDVLADYVVNQMNAAKTANKPFLIVHNELLPHWPVIETPDDRRLGRKPKLANFIGYMDTLVGRLLTAVDDFGIRDNTYVFFMGDNGTWEQDFKNPQASQPGQRPHTRHTKAGDVNGGKADLNDGGSHVPLLVWGPRGINPGGVCTDLVDVVDLFPTFCELSGTSIPSTLEIDGRSLVAQLQSKSGVKRPWVHHAYGNKENLFDGNWRLGRNSGKMLDARALPREKPADLSDPEAAAAKTRLTALFKKISPSGSRPPEAFLKSE
jgi:arylsulfatase A-like enzyme